MGSTGEVGEFLELEMGFFWPQKNPGACFWGRKKPLREWGHAIPRFSIKTAYFWRRKTQGRVFGGGKNPCGKHADSHPGFGQGSVSNLILKIKYSQLGVMIGQRSLRQSAGAQQPTSTVT